MENPPEDIEIRGMFGHAFTIGDGRTTDSADDDVIELGLAFREAGNEMRSISLGFSLEEVVRVRDALTATIERRF